jgi:isopenicillin N synthase-like dioxygenase
MGSGQSATAVDPNQPIARVDVARLLADDADVKPLFLENMLQRGFCVLSLDPQSTEAINGYVDAGQKFFNQDQEKKSQLAKTDDILGKKNEGYLLVDGIKEFLKLKSGDKVPDHPEDLQEKFDNVFKMFNAISRRCFTILAQHQSQRTGNKPYISEELTKTVLEKADARSSVSFIHYFARDPPSERTMDGVLPVHYDENGQNIPSKVHTDTGVMTFILCNDVPGLQVENRLLGMKGDEEEVDPSTFIDVEKICKARLEMFCIMGRKIELFAQQQPPAFKATMHRVALPYKTERHSLLYFMDVPV